MPDRQRRYRERRAYGLRVLPLLAPVETVDALEADGLIGEHPESMDSDLEDALVAVLTAFVTRHGSD